MTTVVIYFKNNTDPISFRVNGSVSQVSNEIIRLIRANEFFPYQTESGAVILQSSQLAGIYFEKD